MLQYNEGEYATMWVDTSLIITPTESSQGDPTTPSEPTTPTNPTQETEEESQIKNPKTGDNIITNVILFITSIVAIGTLTIVSKKTRE